MTSDSRPSLLMLGLRLMMQQFRGAMPCYWVRASGSYDEVFMPFGLGDSVAECRFSRPDGTEVRLAEFGEPVLLVVFLRQLL